MATGTGTITIPALTLSAASLHSSVFNGDIELLAITLSGSLQGPSELPAFTLSATGVTGRAADGDAFLPAVTLSGAALAGGAGVGDLDLPGITLSASTGTKGEAILPRLTVFATGLAGNTSKGRNRVIAGVTVYETQPTLPAFTLSATMLSQKVMTGALTLEQVSLSASAIGGDTGTATITMRLPTLSAAGISGGAPAGDISLPAFTLSATTADGAVATGSITLPELTLAGTAPAQPQPRTGAGAVTLEAATMTGGTMLPGSVATGALVMREPTLDAILANSPPMTGALTLAEFTLSATGLGSNAAVGAVRIDELSLAAVGLAGNVGTATVELPLVQLSASDGVLAVVGTANITLPLFNIGGGASGTGSIGGTAVQVLPSPTFTGIALNTRTKAVTNYGDLAPTSAAQFNGVTLMTTPDGIVALLGDDDLGTPIDAYFTSGKTDLGQSGVKRVLTGYVGYRASGDMELTLIADDHHENVYTLSPRRVEDQQHASRVKFGRGASGVYWQFKAANVDGADFALDRLELLTASTGAKV